MAKELAAKSGANGRQQTRIVLTRGTKGSNAAAPHFLSESNTVTDEEKKWQAETTQRDGATYREGEDLRHRLELAEQQARRLARQLQGRNRQVELLEQGIALTVAIYGAWRASAESEMKELRREIATLRTHRASGSSLSTPEDSVDVSLPYMTDPLCGVFDVMRDVSRHYDGRHPPKSTLIALAIDDRLGMRHQRNGDASRSAQAIASLIRPDPQRQVGSMRRRDHSSGRR
ncbi:hypothetical protein [Paraburkholderia sp. BCC1885]|uniref:hypothetical protein n=1 Tax=Paraburkholderia sp. BCC1885 TaxID=2562669 RepID=UPI0011822546|nr:hypothetical protein [Paraburkholderia sp. BCC1885]